MAKKKKQVGLFSERKFGKEKFSVVWTAGSRVPAKRDSANKRAKTIRDKGRKARVITRTDGSVVVYRGPKRKR